MRNVGYTGECRKTLHCQDWIRSVAFSPEGKIIACACVNHTVEIWDLDSGQRINMNYKTLNLRKILIFSSHEFRDNFFDFLLSLLVPFKDFFFKDSAIALGVSTTPHTSNLFGESQK